MLKIKQYRYGGDNLGYLVYGLKRAVAIDGGAWPDILNFVSRNNLVLDYVVNTHDHFDHTCGNEELLRKTTASELRCDDFLDGQEIIVDDDKITVIKTPGHSLESCCFYTGSALISGDTLFNGTIGNCFSGDLKAFFLSIKRLMALPSQTLVYAGHDYWMASLDFAAHLEPANKDIERFRSRYDPEHVCSTLEEEYLVNPYLRFNTTPIVDVLKERNLPHATEWERWTSLMSIA
ncbi:MAG: MBL fold metallo-hydrolase [Smithellaceae bacterium]|nr:MBL fold metallo-hydrolase [Smithellaceae bacterium]